MNALLKGEWCEFPWVAAFSNHCCQNTQEIFKQTNSPSEIDGFASIRQAYATLAQSKVNKVAVSAC